jgi:L-malate glycosyltransferase
VANTRSSVTAVLPSGSGASVVHQTIDRCLSGYDCITYNRYLEFCPPLLLMWRRYAGAIVHAPPDHAVLITPGHSRLVITFHSYFLDPEFASCSTFSQRLHYSSDLRWLTRKAVRRADRVTAVSQFLAYLVRTDLGFDGDITVIPNGIDVNRFAPHQREHEGIRVLFCGNLARRKGAHLLGDIAKRMDVGIELWIASGLSARHCHIERLANMRLLGAVSYEDMPDLYNQADILVMPTLREGFGLVVAEAMACGLPVVASDCSALPELIVEEQGGYLVSPNDVETFAGRINELARDPALRRQMGIFNRNRVVAEFNQEQMVESYSRLFSELE